LAYSRISQGAWILIGLRAAGEVWNFYLWTYIVTLAIIGFVIPSHFQQLFIIPTSQLIVWIILVLRLVGLPPLWGFFPKIAIVKILLRNSLILLTGLLIVTAIIDFFIYLRISLIAYWEKKAYLIWRKTTKEIFTLKIVWLPILLVCTFTTL
jgi:NADH:ubiquinone oxidoreductase subunit 2 (subunit N)